MKKVFFSAIMMIAFSGVRAVEVDIEDVENILKDEQITLSVCSNVYLDTYQAAVDNGANNEQASAVAWSAYRSCVNSMVEPPKNP